MRLLGAATLGGALTLCACTGNPVAPTVSNSSPMKAAPAASALAFAPCNVEKVLLTVTPADRRAYMVKAQYVSDTPCAGPTWQVSDRWARIEPTRDPFFVRVSAERSDDQATVTATAPNGVTGSADLKF